MFQGSGAWRLRARILKPDSLASNTGPAVTGFRILGLLYTSLLQLPHCKIGMSMIESYHKCSLKTSLVVEWRRMPRVQSLFWEDPTCPRATKPCATTVDTRVPEPALPSKRSHCSEKPMPHLPPLATVRASPCSAKKTQHNQNKDN